MSLTLTPSLISSFFFFFNDTATTEIYTLSLHDALPISRKPWEQRRQRRAHGGEREDRRLHALELEEPALDPVKQHCEPQQDRKSTRLNSSHGYISYAVFCLKKKKKKQYEQQRKQVRHSK